MIHPILDEFYNKNPSYTRNSQFAKDKGLVSNAPGTAEADTPSTHGAHSPSSPLHGVVAADAVQKKLEAVRIEAA